MTIPGTPGLRMILSRPGTVQQLCGTSRASCSFPNALKCWLTIRSANTETTWWMLTYALRRRPLRRSSTMHSSPIVGVPSASVVYPGWTIPVSQDATGPAMVQRQGLSVYMTLTRASRAYTSSPVCENGRCSSFWSAFALCAKCFLSILDRKLLLPNMHKSIDQMERKGLLIPGCRRCSATWLA